MEKVLENKRRSLKFLGYSEDEVDPILQALERILKTENSLSKEDAMDLARKIRPIVSTDINIEAGKPKGNKVWADSSRIYNESYIYKSDSEDYVVAKGLVELQEIVTYHQCFHERHLRPTVYEVLCQIPQDLRHKVVAFELYVETPGDVYSYPLDRHKLKCILYTGKMPEKIANSPVYW